MTVLEGSQSLGLTDIVQERGAVLSQWEEKIQASCDCVAANIKDRVMEIISAFLEKKCYSPVVSLPTNDDREFVTVDCSFKSPLTSIFWQSIPAASDADPSVFMEIRNLIPELEEVEPHEVKPKINYTQLDTLLTCIAKKATDELNKSLQAYCEEEGNDILQFEVRLQTGCSSTASFSKSSVKSSNQAVATSFWVDVSKMPLEQDQEKKEYLSSSLFGFLSLKSKY